MTILAQRFPVFQQAMRIIQSISNSDPVVVTTTFPHQYATGLIVRLNVPQGFGMLQINRLYGPIVVTGDMTFTMAINSTSFDPFVAPTAYPDSYQSAQVTPIGELNEQLQQATRNVLPYAAQ